MRSTNQARSNPEDDRPKRNAPPEEMKDLYLGTGAAARAPASAFLELVEVSSID